MQEFDAIIIGAGQAGNPLSHRLADRGWNVALIERYHLGGSCINYGCTPTKKMIASARVAYTVRKSAEYGVNTSQPHVNLPEIVRQKDELVQQWRAGLEKQVRERPNIHLFRGEASFASPHCVQVNGDELHSSSIFINTGTSSAIPDVQGIQDVPYLTNRTILDLQELPEHLLVLGGSYVGLEFGQMFCRFGSQVTVIETNDQLVPREDAEIAQELQNILEAEGMRFMCSSKANEVKRLRNGELALTLESPNGRPSKTITGSHLLVGAGRIPNTQALNLPAAGIREVNGYIQTDGYLQTNVPGVYALGDVKGGPAFTHISYNDFQVIHHNLFHEEKRSIEGRLVPYALYTDPELGRVGLSEKQAIKAGYQVKIGRIPMSDVARAVERGQTQGMMKIVIDAQTDRILGAAILSAEGGELVQTLMTLMLVDAPYTVLQRAIFIHPTLTEGFFSLIEQVR
jgi:pyruvate/2-oxoglutarate dehydrogenase complex dihydrolipoamide dehydrogenase (E3) component